MRLANQLNSMRETHRVIDAVARWPEQPFEFGRSDCGYFVRHVYLSALGRDLMFYPYRNEQEAEILIGRFGSLTATVDFAVAGRHVEREYVREGDLALYQLGPIQGLGIKISPDEIATICPPDASVVRLSMENVLHGWTIT